MVTRGLIVGRFQPPHLGHLELIKYTLDQVDEIIIAVAAAQISHTANNPLTAGERITMMRIMLSNNDIPADKYWLIPTQDIMDNSLWVAHLKRLLPDFDIFFGNNPFTQLLFNEANIKTKNTPLFERSKYEASQIREKLIKNRTVKQLLDPGVIDYIKKMNLKTRLKGIVHTDSTKKGKKPGSELQDL